jgi:hypothetical protein
MTALSPAARLVAAADRIESLANAATPGPWRTRTVAGATWVGFDDDPGFFRMFEKRPWGTDADAAHIAASDPQTMRLVAALLRAVAAVVPDREPHLMPGWIAAALVLADHYLERNDQ